ncbi:GntR family transcriptional regulator [Aeromicrobium sp. CTD01-1L150]|uniref:GntR family transcriptional regulator n=1 Tax=Aeromicrobium sp. CTD01-1L150 TaxID=3341830 RepID=UPI0035C26915
MAERTVPPSKTQFVYEWLREEILSGSLGPGSHIRQQEVARELGVSYTPVREAIRQLQANGLVTYEPHRGNAVTSLDDDALLELYQLRGAVEGLAARLAAVTMTPEALEEIEAVHARAQDELDKGGDSSTLADLSRRFHTLVVEQGGPKVVLPKLHEIWNHYPVPRSQSLWADPAEARRSLDAHGRIIEALRSGEAASAGTLMEEHIVESVRYRLVAD